MSGSRQGPPIRYAISCATCGDELAVRPQFGDAEAELVAEHHRRQHPWRAIAPSISAALAACRMRRLDASSQGD